MNVAENLVLSKLRDYREKANRDRFILPEDRDISFFTKVQLFPEKTKHF